MSDPDQVIDSLEDMLRQLDRQHALLDEVIANINAVAAPRTRPTVPRGRPVGSIAPDLFDVAEESDSSSDWEREDVLDSDEEAALDSDSVFTTFYHSDMWGVYPRGVDRPTEWWHDGYDSGYESDAETVVAPWEDPNLTPMKHLAPVASGYYSPFDDHMD
jgi:hypothetical protein